MLLCDVASLIRLSIRFRAANAAAGTPSCATPAAGGLDYNIASTSASTWGEAGTRGRGDAGTGRRGDGVTR